MGAGKLWNPQPPAVNPTILILPLSSPMHSPIWEPGTYGNVICSFVFCFFFFMRFSMKGVVNPPKPL